MLGERDESAVGTEDACFFAGDLGDGVAKVVLMVESNVGEDGEDWLDDVGGVETTSQAHFKDGDVHRDLFRLRPVLCGEVEKTYRGEHLEEAGGVRQVAGFDEMTGGLVDLKVEAGEVFVGNLVPIDLDSFVDPN